MMRSSLDQDHVILILKILVIRIGMILMMQNRPGD